MDIGVVSGIIMGAISRSADPRLSGGRIEPYGGYDGGLQSTNLPRTIRSRSEEFIGSLKKPRRVFLMIAAEAG